MRLIPLLLTTLFLLAACSAPQDSKNPALSSSDYARYVAARTRYSDALHTQFLGLTGPRRITTQMRALAERHNPENVTFVAALVAVADKHHIPVAPSLRMLRPAGKATPEDIAWTGALAMAIYDGPNPGGGPKAKSGVPAEQLSPAFISDLRLAIARACPDRLVRLSVLNNGSMAGDVREPTDAVQLAQYQAISEFRKIYHEAWESVLDSLADRPDSPSNVSALECFDSLQGNGLGEVMYYYCQTIANPTGDEMQTRAKKLRSAALAIRRLDSSPEAQKIVGDVLDGMDKAQPWFEGMDQSIIQWHEQIPVMTQFVDALARNSKEGIEACCEPELARVLASTSNMAAKVLKAPDPTGLRLSYPGLPGSHFNSDTVTADQSIYVVYLQKGKIEYDTVNVKLRRSEGRWRIVEVLGVNDPFTKP